jgi:hypothetical protein
MRLSSGLALAASLFAAVTHAQDGGVLKGTAVFSGVVPVMTIIPKDRATCGEPFKEAQIAVGANQGVMNAVVYLEGIKGKSMPKQAKTPELDNKGCKFAPEVQVIPPGSIEIINSDPVLHNTHGFYGKRTAFNVALPNQGQRITASLP